MQKKLAHKRHPIINIKIYDLEEAFLYKKAINYILTVCKISNDNLHKTHKTLCSIVDNEIINS